jgi:hypothetical protein
VIGPLLLFLLVLRSAGDGRSGFWLRFQELFGAQQILDWPSPASARRMDQAPGREVMTVVPRCGRESRVAVESRRAAPQAARRSPRRTDRMLAGARRCRGSAVWPTQDPPGRRAMAGKTYRAAPMPPITRDLSVAVPDDDDEETLGDRVRDALGADTGCVEEVKVLSATAYQQLPASAIGRLGAKPGQKNLLVRVVLRDLEKTLTNQAANALRDRIYWALHQAPESGSQESSHALGGVARCCLLAD